MFFDMRRCILDQRLRSWKSGKTSLFLKEMQVFSWLTEFHTTNLAGGCWLAAT